MAKKQPQSIMFDTYTAGIFGRTEGYADRVRQLYAQAVTELLKLAQSHGVKEDEMFEFDKLPNKLRAEANKILRLLYTSVYNEVQHGIRAEWEYANLSNDIIIKRIFGDAVFKNEGNHFARWFARNQQAMDAFLKRKSGADRLGLSERIWNYTGQLKDEMELALSVSMGQGESAATMSRKVRQYLQEPERLFRHVKGKDGKMRWSKAAKEYLRTHDIGRGQYLSSYKNAMRLTRTETNMAYRASDSERWQQLDFVLGIHIRRADRSDNDKDICEELQGDYPKTFKFTGWHPQCRCIATPILATVEEAAAMRKAMKEGKDPRSVLAPGRYITEPPKAFTQWIDDNRERIENAASVPYFIRDNYKDGDIDKGFAWVKVKKEKTQAEKEAIAAKWNERKRHNTLIKKMGNNVYNVAAGYPDIDTADLIAAINSGNITQIEAQARAVAKEIAGLNKQLKGMETLIDNPKQWLAQGFKVADLQKVFNAVEGNMSKWKGTYTSNTYLQGKYTSVEDYLLHKLSYEIAYVADPSKFKAGATQYPTWEVAQNAYLKQQSEVQDILVWRDIESQAQTLFTKLSNGLYNAQIAKLDKAIIRKQKDEAQNALSELQAWSDVNDVLQEALTFVTKSTPYLNLIAQLKQDIASDNLTNALNTVLAMQQKRKELKKAADRRHAKSANADLVVDFTDGCFTQERKDKAKYFKTAPKANDYFFDSAVDYYRIATESQKDAFARYTAGSAYITEPLRAIKGHYYYSPWKHDFSEIDTDIREMTEALRHCEMRHDVWIKRDSASWQIEYIFKIPSLAAYRSNPSALVGMIGTDDSFMSCGSCRGTRFTCTEHKDVIYNLYCPQGTKMVYAHPFSSCGAYGKGWDGTQKPTVDASKENEIIMQRGTKLRITKAEYDATKDLWYIDMDVIGQNPRDYQLIQTSSGVYAQFK